MEELGFEPRQSNSAPVLTLALCYFTSNNDDNNNNNNNNTLVKEKSQGKLETVQSE